MVPWPVIWALRKVALVPGLAITAAALGGAYGTFDLSRRAFGLVIPAPKSKNNRAKGSVGVSTFGAFTAGSIVIGLREIVFKPYVPPPPSVAPPDFTPAGLKRAYALVLHALMNYPYKHRFNTFFGAGITAGAAYVLADRAWNARSDDTRERMIASQAKADRYADMADDEPTFDSSDNTREDDAAVHFDRGDDGKALSTEARLSLTSSPYERGAPDERDDDFGRMDTRESATASSSDTASASASGGAKAVASNNPLARILGGLKSKVDAQLPAARAVAVPRGGVMSTSDSDGDIRAYDENVGGQDEVGTGVEYEDDPYARGSARARGR